MAKHYKKRPSEILSIDNDYLAYIFDKTALYLESEATDEKGNTNWNKIKWKDNKKGNNKELLEFIQNKR
ncbi:hypothetical protein [Wansuia hejianensis]|uniref:Uncharacterized protein n=1 Tax=Wansuia hejianensis TaxID=2763667 RepID=A0A926IHF4_9FIRM|nr:hypothetical protein [Wansuia hejianensis]MBC8590607.1 hypothetical protein [Wansuia hejianensis]